MFRETRRTNKNPPVKQSQEERDSFWGGPDSKCRGFRVRRSPECLEHRRATWLWLQGTALGGERPREPGQKGGQRSPKPSGPESLVPSKVTGEPPAGFGTGLGSSGLYFFKSSFWLPGEEWTEKQQEKQEGRGGRQEKMGSWCDVMITSL